MPWGFGKSPCSVVGRTQARQARVAGWETQHFCDGLGVGGGGRRPKIELDSSWGIRGKCGGAGWTGISLTLSSMFSFASRVWGRPGAVYWGSVPSGPAGGCPFPVHLLNLSPGAGGVGPDWPLRVGASQKAYPGGGRVPGVILNFLFRLSP